MTGVDTAIKNAKPTPDKPYKLQDEKGMYLLVNPNGSKYFRYTPDLMANVKHWHWAFTPPPHSKKRGKSEIPPKSK